MVNEMSEIDDVVLKLSSVGLQNVFNPYSDRCALYDYEDSPEIRLILIRRILEVAASVNVEAIWVGRDLGYRGGRRTGLPLTDDVHFNQHLKRWGLESILPVKGGAVAERTASVVWGALSKIPDHVFMWNVFPFHPFNQWEEFSNRQHSSYERAVGEEIFRSIVSIVRPRRFVCIGNDAHKSVERIFLGSKSIKVRHPSYGGKNDFLRQISLAYNMGGEAGLGGLF